MNKVRRSILLTAVTALSAASTASADYFVEKWVSNAWVAVNPIGYDIVPAPGAPPTIRFKPADFFGQFESTARTGTATLARRGGIEVRPCH
ncbi:MAG: hypothetical protein ACKVZJ_07025 [Phycisphaerales bacterium]